MAYKRKRNCMLGLAALLLVLLSLMMPARASAVTVGGSCGASVRWSYDTESATLTISGTGRMNDYSRGSIPWYSYKDSIQTLIIEPGVTYIGTEAFYECSRMKTASIPDTVTAIGGRAFCWCERLGSIDIPGSVKTIGDAAFWCCLELTSITFHEGLEVIEEEAFNSCELVTSLVFPSTLREIGYWCFGGCSRIETITFSSGLKNIGDSVFSACTSLRSVKLPDTLETIGSSSFSYCYALRSIDIPEGVYSIGDTAFYLCQSLTELTIPGSVSSIGDCCFGNCPALKSVRFAGPAPSFSDATSFRGATATVLYPADEPGWTEDILHDHEGDLAWYPYGEGGVELSGASGDVQWDVRGDCLSISGEGAMDNYSGVSPAPWGRLHGVIRHVTVAPGVTHIGDNAFSGLGLVSSVELPESVASIGNLAFADSGLDSVRFLGRAAIEADAFSGVSAAASYPDDGSWAADALQNYGGSLSWSPLSLCENHDFSDWTLILQPGCESSGAEQSVCSLCGLVSTRPVASAGHSFGEASVTAPDCLNHGYSLQSCAVCGFVRGLDKTAPLGHSWDAGVKSGSKTTFTCLSCGEKRYEYSISGSCGSYARWTLDTDSGVLRITGSGSTSGRPWKSYESSIRHVVVESGITGIGAEAFFECGSIETVELADTVRSIGAQAFVWCKNMRSINIPEGVTSLPDSAFWGCQSLEELILPSTLRSIGEDCFYSCESLEELRIPEGVTSIGELAFWQCYGLKEVSIPSTLTTLPENLFSSCRSLETVELPATLLVIGEDCFDGCRSLVNISLPDSLISIGDYAFWNCAALESITIPGSVESIGASVFNGCSSLRSVRFAGNPPTFDASSFKGATTTAFYPSGNSRWTYSVRQSYGGSLRWVSYGSSGPIASGSSGSLKWKMEGNTLVITGTGSGSYYSAPPWYHLRGEIYQVELAEGVTGLGSYFLKDLYKLEHLTLPSTVTSLQNTAFYGCSALKHIDFMGSAPSMGSSVFSGITAQCSYPAGQSGWTGQMLKNYGGLISWNARYESCAAHSFGEWTVLRAPGCDDAGLLTRKCLNCGAIENSRGTALGHDFVNTVKPVACLHDGYTLHSCSRCDYYYMDKYVSAVGHSWDEGTGTTTTWTYTCTSCGEKRVEYTVGGSCGTNVKWRLSTETGLLTIYGSGSMRSFGRTSQPWSSYVDKITDVVVESGVTSIGSYAFYEHPNLKTVTLPSTIRSLGLGSFAWSTMLEAIHIPEGVTSIPEDCFWACSGLKELTLPSTLKTIGQGAFYSNRSLTKLELPAGLTFIDEDAFWQCYGITEVVIPQGVTAINYCSFCSCTALKSVTLPDGITKLDRSAFNGCSKLSSINMPASLKTIGINALSDIIVSELTFSPSLTYIDSGAFYGSSIRAIHFTGNAPEFDPLAFQGLSTTAYYPLGNPTWTAEVRQSYGGSIRWVGEYSCPHDYELEVVVEPGCSTTGRTEYVCSMCFDRYDGEALPALGHSFGEYSHNADGTMSADCSRCGITDVVLGPEIRYQISDISLHDTDGVLLPTIPAEKIFATVFVNKTGEAGDALVLLVCYTAEGRYHSLQYQSVSGLDLGESSTFVFGIDNSSGEIAEVRAFTLVSLSDPKPLGNLMRFSA